MTTYVRNSDIEAAPMMEETILYSPAAKQFCVLNPTAAYIWDQLAQPTTTEGLARGLRDAFAAEGADIERDVRSTLEQFQTLQMIRELEGA